MPRGRLPNGIKRSQQTSASGTASTTPQPPSQAERLSYHDAPRPFKNPAFKRSSNKRNKSARQIIALERESVSKLAEQRASEGLSIRPEEETTTYWSVEAAPSVLPRPKYCDITGLSAPYTDPKTRLRYATAEVYDIIRQMPAGSDQHYLALRGANVVLR